MMKTRKGNSMAKVSTYKAMISALVCTFLCVAMLCGMTYAWYLGYIESGDNTIKIGTYNVSVKYSGDPSSITTAAGSDIVYFSASNMKPGDYQVCYFQVTNDTDNPANVKIYITPESKNADVKIYAAPTTGAYTPSGDGMALTSLTEETVIDATGWTVPARTGATPAVSVIAVAVKLPEDSLAAGKTSTFTLRFDVTQTAKS